MNTLKNILQLFTCCLLLLTVAVNRNGRIFGLPTVAEANNVVAANEWEDGEFHVITTANIAKEVWGYGGNVPLNIYLKDGRIDHVVALPNSESPEYFKTVEDGGLLAAWDGKTPSEAATLHVDGVTGATMSSTAVIESMHKAMEYAEGASLSASNRAPAWKSLKFWCGLLVVICGMIIPFLTKNKKYRTIQLSLNFIVLGIWSGTFISLSLMVNYLSNGVHLATAIIPLLLLVAAFIYPLFGKKQHYCTWICPLGSAQELLGKALKKKIRMSPNAVKYLTWFRELLWMLLLAVMWLGVGFELMDYELFSAFMFNQAPVALMIVAGLFAILSAFVPRPYCRFVCPTGSIIKFSQNTK